MLAVEMVMPRRMLLSVFGISRNDDAVAWAADGGCKMEGGIEAE